MINILISTNKLKLIKKITNIISFNGNVRLLKIATNESETVKILNNEKIDILFLDMENIKNNLNKILEEIYDSERKICQNSVIIIINKIIDIKQSVNNNIVIEYIFNRSNDDEITYKINKIIQSKDVNEKRKKIIQELNYINYNLEYKGTNYLIDVILYMYMNKNLMLNNLQKDIYPRIAEKYNTSVNTIRCNIRHATNNMYYECDDKRLKEYFGLGDNESPTSKEVIYTILNKLI